MTRASAFDLTRFHSLLTTRSFGRNFLFEPSVGSTMDVARAAADEGAPEGTVVAADEQTAGRGRMGRGWITPAAVNLATTTVLKPPMRVVRQVAMMPPLAVARAAADVAGLGCDIKWPNDVQAAGKKLAGVLIETDLSEPAHPLLLVGVGINVNFDPREHEEIRDIATSFAAELGHTVEREAVLAAFLAHFERLYDEAVAGASPVAAWRERLVTLGRRVHASWPGGSADGVAEDVDGDGSLIVVTDGGERITVEAGDVTLRE